MNIILNLNIHLNPKSSVFPKLVGGKSVIFRAPQTLFRARNDIAYQIKAGMIKRI